MLGQRAGEVQPWRAGLTCWNSPHDRSHTLISPFASASSALVARYSSRASMTLMRSPGVVIYYIRYQPGLTTDMIPHEGDCSRGRNPNGEGRSQVPR